VKSLVRRLLAHVWPQEGPGRMSVRAGFVTLIIAILLMPILVRSNHAQLVSVLGPIVGAAISLFVVGLNEQARYYSSTSELDYELDMECGADCKKEGRISALIENKGPALVKHAKAVVSIYVHQNDWEKNLRKVIMSKNDCKSLLVQNQSGVLYDVSLVSERNPYVLGEALPWALPETDTPYRVVFKIGNAVYELPYTHITSISPSQRARLLIFEYKLNDRQRFIAVFSEYGGEGPADVFRPRRVCLKLDENTKYRFEVTVYGEGTRKPLTFSICVDLEKLDKITTEEISRQDTLEGDEVMKTLECLPDLQRRL